MKASLTALELSHVVKELQFLIGARVQKIYNPEKKVFIFDLHVPSRGRAILKANLAGMMHLMGAKGSYGEPSGFCMFLRRRLANARLRALSQIEFERIVEFLFETKDNSYILIIELFGGGNMILCDKDRIILSPLENQKWKGRTVAPKEKYAHPGKGINFLTLKKENLDELIKASKRDSVVKLLAMDLGLGGVYAEEACLMSGVDKGSLPKETGKLYDALKKLRGKKTKAFVVEKGGVVVDIIPFDLQHYDSEKKPYSSYSEALDSISVETAAQAAPDKKHEKLKRIIERQESTIIDLEKSVRENTGKGDLLYLKYAQVRQILDDLKQARMKYSWKEIKEKLRGHKVVKEINEKERTIVLDLNE
ncbi:MAG: NFACT family protein [archaeon]